MLAIMAFRFWILHPAIDKALRPLLFPKSLQANRDLFLLGKQNHPSSEVIKRYLSTPPKLPNFQQKNMLTCLFFRHFSMFHWLSQWNIETLKRNDGFDNLACRQLRDTLAHCIDDTMLTILEELAFWTNSLRFDYLPKLRYGFQN